MAGLFAKQSFEAGRGAKALPASAKAGRPCTCCRMIQTYWRRRRSAGISRRAQDSALGDWGLDESHQSLAIVGRRNGKDIPVRMRQTRIALRQRESEPDSYVRTITTRVCVDQDCASTKDMGKPRKQNAHSFKLVRSLGTKECIAWKERHHEDLSPPTTKPSLRSTALCYWDKCDRITTPTSHTHRVDGATAEKPEKEAFDDVAKEYPISDQRDTQISQPDTLGDSC